MTTYTITAAGQFPALTLAPDDIVTADGAVIAEFWDVNQQGTSGHPITIQDVNLSGSASRAYCMDLSGGLSYLSLRDVVVRDSTTRNVWGDNTANGIDIDGLESIGGAIGVWLRGKSNSSFKNIYAHGQTGAGFYLSNAASNVTVDSIRVDGGSAIAGSLALQSVTKLTASTLEINNSTDVGLYFRSGLGLLSVDGVILNDCGPASAYPALYVKDYTVSAGSTFDNVTIVDSNYIGATFEYTGDLSLLTCDNWEILRSEYHNLYINGINAGVFSNSVFADSISGSGVSVADTGIVTVNNSVVSGNFWDGFSTSSTGKLTSLRCYVFDNGSLGGSYGDGYTSHAASVNNLFAFNIIHDNWNTALAVIGTSSGKFHNNVCVNNHVAGQTRGSLWFSTVGSVLGWTCYNNIVVNTTTGDAYAGILVMLATATTDMPTLDYNCYWSTNPTPFWVHNGGTSGTPADFNKYDFAGWKTFSGQDAHSFFINPQLTADYKIPDNSPLAHMGLVVSGVNDAGQLDIFGNATSAHPNIGVDQGAAPGYGPWADFDGTIPAWAIPAGVQFTRYNKIVDANTITKTLPL